MTNHDPNTHNGMAMSFVFDAIKGNKSKHSSVWVRLGLVTLRLTLIGLLMLSPFIFLILLVVLFD